MAEVGMSSGKYVGESRHPGSTLKERYVTEVNSLNFMQDCRMLVWNKGPEYEFSALLTDADRFLC